LSLVINYVFNYYYNRLQYHTGSSELKCLSVLLHEADAHLFWKMANNKERCIHQLLPPAKTLSTKLCHSRCLFALRQCCHFNLCQRLFV